MLRAACGWALRIGAMALERAAELVEPPEPEPEPTPAPAPSGAKAAAACTP